MNLIKRLWLACLFVFSTLIINYNAHSAASTYGVSCTNTSYGTQLGDIYLQLNPLTTGNGQAQTYGMYTSTDCIYGGAGRTNSSAIIGGEIARAAANAVVGAVSNRINNALAMAANPETAHMTYSADGAGIGMAANHIIGGLSAWVSFADSSFDNDQTFSNLSTDSNQFDGSASSVSFGVDKTFGNMLVGINMTSFSSDVTTKANNGSMDTEGETVGLYVGLNTGVLSIAAGAGTGEYEVDLARTDLGTGTKDAIKANDVTADIQYYFLNASATLTRGKLSFSPRVGYRNFDLDMPAFTDIVLDVAASTDLGDGIDSTNADEAIGGKTYSSDLTEAGISIALSTGARLIPYVDLAYVNEDTTKASYSTELVDDSVTDLNASAPDGYVTYGGGFILNLSSKVNGYLNYSETSGRDDFNETTLSGSLRIKF